MAPPEAEAAGFAGDLNMAYTGVGHQMRLTVVMQKNE